MARTSALRAGGGAGHHHIGGGVDRSRRTYDYYKYYEFHRIRERREQGMFVCLEIIIVVYAEGERRFHDLLSRPPPCLQPDSLQLHASRYAALPNEIRPDPQF